MWIFEMCIIAWDNLHKWLSVDNRMQIRFIFKHSHIYLFVCVFFVFGFSKLIVSLSINCF